MEDPHVAGRGGDVCGGFALPGVHELVAHRDRTVPVFVCVVAKKSDFWQPGVFSA